MKRGFSLEPEHGWCVRLMGGGILCLMGELSCSVNGQGCGWNECGWMSSQVGQGLRLRSSRAGTIDNRYYRQWHRVLTSIEYHSVV